MNLELEDPRAEESKTIHGWQCFDIDPRTDGRICNMTQSNGTGRFELALPVLETSHHAEINLNETKRGTRVRSCTNDSRVPDGSKTIHRQHCQQCQTLDA